MAHVHHCPAIVEHIAAGTPIEDLRKSLQRIGPVVSLVRNTELFNGCEVHLDSAFATFQLKDALDFSAIPPIHAYGNMLCDGAADSDDQHLSARKSAFAELV
jgi:hypothetical protein